VTPRERRRVLDGPHVGEPLVDERVGLGGLAKQRDVRINSAFAASSK